jgi:hypothetical protein
MHSCPLCLNVGSHLYHEDKKRQYFQCECCSLVFVAPESLLNREQEKAHYDLHENEVMDEGYQRFLSRLAIPLMEKLTQPSIGLDFGCGPGPALQWLLQQQGHNVALYDLYYHPDRAVLERSYDFMTSTEVIEHLYTPAEVWQQWLNLVKKGGWIGIMTKMVIDAEAFATWHYKNDPTHVCFYSRDTFRFLAQRDLLELEFIGNDVILLRKPH